MGEDRYKVWGFTARLLVEAARIAYDEAPEFNHTTQMGNEDVILSKIEQGDFILRASAASWSSAEEYKQSRTTSDGINNGDVPR